MSKSLSNLTPRNPMTLEPHYAVKNTAETQAKTDIVSLIGPSDRKMTIYAFSLLLRLLGNISTLAPYSP